MHVGVRCRVGVICMSGSHAGLGLYAYCGHMHVGHMHDAVMCMVR